MGFNFFGGAFEKALKAVQAQSDPLEGVASEEASAAVQAIVEEPVVAARPIYEWSQKSRREQLGVHPILVRVSNRAIELSLVDMVFHDGVRTITEQRDMVRRKVSKTMASKHLKQPDGFGHAMDLVAWVDGAISWDWRYYYLIACAVDAAATEQGVADKIVWGGAWDRRLSDFGGEAEAYAREVVAYRARHPGPDFIDGPHFELRL